MKQHVAVFSFSPGRHQNTTAKKGIIRYYLLICASVTVYARTCSATDFAYRSTISRNYETDAVLYSFGPYYHISTESHRAGKATSKGRVVSFRGHHDFTTQLRRQGEQEQIPRAGPGPGMRSQQATDKLALWEVLGMGERGGGRTEIDIATTVVSGKTERRTGL